MRWLDAHLPNLAAVLHRDAVWMTWNTLLAWAPVALALVLFRRGTARTPLWWAGVVLFGLFLPNAPYVVTDLVHLGQDVRLMPSDWAVVTAVLPVYGVLIGSGLLAYYLALAQLGRYLEGIGLAAWRAPTFLAVHALCALGVYLGRHARLNSWEPVVEPHNTLQRVLLAVSWKAAPLFLVATFVVVAVGHFVTRAVVEALWRGAQRVRAWPARPWPAPPGAEGGAAARG